MLLSWKFIFWSKFDKKKNLIKKKILSWKKKNFFDKFFFSKKLIFLAENVKFELSAKRWVQKWCYCPLITLRSKVPKIVMFRIIAHLIDRWATFSRSARVSSWLGWTRPLWGRYTAIMNRWQVGPFSLTQHTRSPCEPNDSSWYK